MSSRPHQRSRAHLAQWLICFLSFTVPAVAQLDSTALRAKYGTPLNRETFRMPEGFDLVVDYGWNNQVCKLQVPALMPTTEQVSNASVMTQRMYAFLAELVPDTTRGKLIGQSAMATGAISVLFFEYEHVTVSELQAGDPFSHDNVITVSFIDACKGLNVR